MEKETFYPENQQEWRQWLLENHLSKQSIWLVCYKKKTNIPTISWSDAVDEALCFGWIDSTRVSAGDDKFLQFFTKRKPKSIWSKINKEKIKHLDANGLIAKAGYESIEIAKKNGSWTILDEVEELLIPDDFDKALSTQNGSKEFFLSLSKSLKKQILYWFVSAKRPETRQKRIDEIVELAAQKMKPKQFQ